MRPLRYSIPDAHASRRAAAGPYRLLASGVILVCLAAAGCTQQSTKKGPGSGSGPRSPDEELFDDAIAGLQRLDQFDEGQVMQQTVDRLNRWLRTQKPLESWSVDPLVQRAAVGSVAEDSPSRSMIDEMVHGLGRMELTNYDGLALMEAVLLRRVSDWARGEQSTDLGKAKALFDWSVRNVQPVAAPYWIDPIWSWVAQCCYQGQAGVCLGLQPLRVSEWARWNALVGDTAVTAPPRTPWQILMAGRGSWIERGWVFLLLARQQGLDAVWLAVPEAGPGNQWRLRYWTVAVVSEGELYLFDPQLGLPIPAADGVPRVQGQGLDIQPATLTQFVNDAAVLQGLDLGAGEGEKYWVRADDARNVVAMVEASPAYVKQPLALIESKLSGDEKVVLSTLPTELARRVVEHPNVAEARLWPVPYQVFARQMLLNPQGEFRLFWQTKMIPFDLYTPDLWIARVRHLGGTFVGEQGAIRHYQEAFVLDSELEDVRRGFDRALKDALVKHDASYWLGTLQSARGDPAEAIRYFDERTLGAWPQTRASAVQGLQTAVEVLENQLAKPPELRTVAEAVPGFVRNLRMTLGMLEAAGPSPWAHGATYNWARAAEALGQVDEAARLLESDPGSPNHYGNRLRARLLRGTAEEPPDGGSSPAEPESPSAGAGRMHNSFVYKRLQ